MRTTIKVIEVIGTLVIAVPALILGGIIGIWWGGFLWGYRDGKDKVS